MIKGLGFNMYAVIVVPLAWVQLHSQHGVRISKTGKQLNSLHGMMRKILKLIAVDAVQTIPEDQAFAYYQWRYNL